MVSMGDVFMGRDPRVVRTPTLVTYRRKRSSNEGSIIDLGDAALVWLRRRNESRSSSAVSDRAHAKRVFILVHSTRFGNSASPRFAYRAP